MGRGSNRPRRPQDSNPNTVEGNEEDEGIFSVGVKSSYNWCSKSIMVVSEEEIKQM